MVGGGVFENVARMVRGGDVTVCSAVLLSMRHVVVVVPSSAWFIFLTPGWGRAELMSRFGVFGRFHSPLPTHSSISGSCSFRLPKA